MSYTYANYSIKKKKPVFASAKQNSVNHASSVKNILQAKLKIGQPNDKYEQEADQVAEKVLAMPSSGITSTEGKNSLVENRVGRPGIPQRMCTACEREEDQIQRKSISNVDSQLPSTIGKSVQVLQGTGQPLSSAERNFFEPRFGANFTHVRKHVGTHAAKAARSINAQAFTLGNNVVFGAGEHSSATVEGQKILAHELTHVLQQNASYSNLQNDWVQRTIGDGHDLEASRFSGNEELEAALDDERYVRFGSRGEHVSLIQQALMDTGFELPKYGADGIFGSETSTAVKEFQREFGLVADAIVGPITMGTLDNIFSPVINEVDIDDAEGSDVLDGDDIQGPTFPVGEESLEQKGETIEELESFSISGQSEVIQTKGLSPPPAKVKPPSIKLITINLKSQDVKIKWSNGKVRGPYDISSGKGCPNTKGDPCKNPKRSDKDTYCTPKGNGFTVEGLGGKNYKSRQGDAMSWYVAFVAKRGIGIHDAQPVTGTPKSHGCVRVVDSVAKLMHNNVTKSTKINVVGKAPTKRWKLSKPKTKKSYKGCPLP